MPPPPSFAAAGAKSAAGTEGGLTKLASWEASATEWKLTLKDENRSGFYISTTSLTDTTATVNYYNAKTGANEYISAVVTFDDEIYYYGRLLRLDGVNDADGTVTVTIPSDVTLRGNVRLYLFNEQYNGDYMTDYSSELWEVSSPNKVTLVSVEAANGSDTASTTALTLTFSAPIHGGLSVDDITIVDNKAVKGMLTQIAGTNTYTLLISGITVADKESIQIAVNKTDYEFSGSPMSVEVRVFVPVYQISIEGSDIDAMLTEGYTAITPHTHKFFVVNTGNSPLIFDAPPNIDDFVIEPVGDWSTAVAPGGTQKFTATPNTGLVADSCTETLSVITRQSTTASYRLSFTVDNPLNIDISGDTSITVGKSATFRATVTGGTGNFRYQWSGGGISDTTPEVTISPDITTTYTLTVTDESSVSRTAEFTVTVNENPPTGDDYATALRISLALISGCTLAATSIAITKKRGKTTA